ncbi:iron-containing redox enzyme family protein [Archangium violaceum]|nr:iron-containing redox enzyme family protein [Archangium violaceum]
MTDWTQQLLAMSRTLVHTLDRRQVPRSLFEGTIFLEHYIAWGIQTYFYVQETQPNLLKSCRRMKRRGRRHAVIADLLLTKAEEETKHDEWMLSDLRTLGCSRTEVERTQPCGAVRAYIATNRFHAEEGSPYAILGTAFILEFLSEQRASKAALNLIARSKIPGIAHAVSFVSQHGQLDGGHVDDALRLLRVITCPREQGAILSMAKFTASLIPSFFPKLPRKA